MKTFSLLLLCITIQLSAQSNRSREYGIVIGSYQTGKYNAITDVEGVKVAHFTLNSGNDVRTGVTAIHPYDGNIFMNKVPAAIYVANGFGKLIGITQVDELGELETPIILTNTLSVPIAADAVIDYILSLDDNYAKVRSINPVVGETNDGQLNNIQGRHIKKEHVLEAINNASSGIVEEGSVGAGTGTIAFNYKGGIGTSSRVLPDDKGGYTVGVLVQTNFGGNLTIAGIEVGKELKFQNEDKTGDGSCMIIVATDAPISSRNLKRLAKRAIFGFAKTGANGSNGSGDYVIAFSTAEELRIPHFANDKLFVGDKELRNDKITPLFEAVIEATEEAIINSIFKAETTKGRNNITIEKLPVERVIEILNNHKLIN